jgi:hypothetical protein
MHEEMHADANSEQQQQRRCTEQVSAVLEHEQESCDDEENAEHKAGGRTPESTPVIGSGVHK